MRESPKTPSRAPRGKILASNRLAACAGRDERGEMEPHEDRRPTRSERVVVALARLLSQLHPFVIVATLLVICLAVYAVAWALAKHS